MTTTGASTASPPARVTPFYPHVPGVDLLDGGIEAEPGAAVFRCALQIVRGKLRVRNVTAGRKEHGAFDPAAVGRAERRVVRPSGGGKAVELNDRHAIENLFGIEMFVWTADFLHDVTGLAQIVVAFGLQKPCNRN